MTEEIGVAEFTNRLAAICGGGRLTALPRKERDVAIVLAASTLWMDTGSVYSEQEINQGLQRWLDTACPALGLDVVTLRRELVDRHYLDRDDSGRHYSPAPGPSRWRFSDGIAGIDPKQVLDHARDDRLARKLAHLESEATGAPPAESA
jgi:hypothetical protein